MNSGLQYHGMFQIGLRETMGFNLHRARGRILTLGISVAAFLYVILLFYLHHQNGNWAVSAFSALPASLAVGLLAAYIRIFLLRRKIEKAFSNGSIHPFVQNIRLNEKGISVLSGGIRTAYSWKELLRHQETKGAFYLYFPDRKSYFLPKAQMDGEVDITLVRSILHGIPSSN